MPQSARKYLTAQVSDDKLEEVFEFLFQDYIPLDSEVKKQVTLLGGRLANLAEQLRTDIISSTDARQERAKIRKALLELTAELPPELKLTPEQETQKKKRQFVWLLGGGIYLIVGGLLLFLAVSKKRNIRIEGRINVDQVSFTHLRGSYNLGGRVLGEAGISFFEEVNLEADSLAWNEDLGDDFGKTVSLSGPISLRPLPGSEAVILPIIGALKLDELSIAEGAGLSISLPERDISPRLIHFLMSKTPAVRGRFSYLKDVILQPEQVEVTGIPEITELLSPVELKLIGPAESSRDISFKSFPKDLFLELQMKDSLDIQGLGLRVDSLNFLRKDLDQIDPISSILGGDLFIVEAGKEVLKKISLYERRKLRLSTKKALEIERLHITAEGIELYLNGSVQKIEIDSAFTNYNPTWLAWLWHNYQIPVIGLGILLLGFVFFLPTWIKKRIIGTLKTLKDLT